MTPRQTKPAKTPVDFAVEHLARTGYTILDRPTTRRALFQIVAQRDETLVFTAVRGLPEPSARPDYATQRQRLEIRKAAARWLSAHAPLTPAARDLRFDAIAVTLDASGRLVRLDHVEALY